MHRVHALCACNVSPVAVELPLTTRNKGENTVKSQAQTQEQIARQAMTPLAGTALAFVALISVGLISIGGVAMAMMM
jgi:hypothetical protein